MTTTTNRGKMNALSIVRTFDNYSETNRYGAFMLDCVVEGKHYTAVELGEGIDALTTAAERLLAEITK
jgi:hypothetical protein